MGNRKGLQTVWDMWRLGPAGGFVVVAFGRLSATGCQALGTGAKEQQPGPGKPGGL